MRKRATARMLAPPNCLDQRSLPRPAHTPQRSAPDRKSSPKTLPLSMRLRALLRVRTALRGPPPLCRPRPIETSPPASSERPLFFVESATPVRVRIQGGDWRAVRARVEARQWRFAEHIVGRHSQRRGAGSGWHVHIRNLLKREKQVMTPCLARAGNKQLPSAPPAFDETYAPL